MAQTGLGRGLGSLIPKNKDEASARAMPSQSAAGGKDRISDIAVGLITHNPQQPRERFSDFTMDELVESIKKYGIIQPLIATRKGEGFELIAGERRLRAARTAGLEKVPVMIRDASEQEKLELALIENIQREDLNPIELAHSYGKLIEEFNLTQDEVAKRVGKSRPVITNTLRLLLLPEEIKLALIEGKISEAHARLIIGLESQDKMMSLFRKIIHNSMTVADTYQESRRLGGTKQARIKINYADKDKEFALREFFGTRAEIKRKGKGGQIIIDFYSDEELGEIIKKVKK